MNRPLNKKYFGNNNTGGILGSGLSTITVVANNSGFTTYPQIIIPNPTFELGSVATAKTYLEIDTITIINGGTITESGIGYYVQNQLLTLNIDHLIEATIKVTSDTNGTGIIDQVELINRGSFDSLPLNVSNIGVNIGDAIFSLTFKIKLVEIIDKGDGYVIEPTITTSVGTTTFSCTLEESYTSIVAYAKIGIGPNSIADIIKQTGSRSFIVHTVDGIGECILVDDHEPIISGEMNIRIKDPNTNNIYYVTKITNNAVTYSDNNGVDFISVPWSFNSDYMQVENSSLTFSGYSGISGVSGYSGL